jgi:transcription antitermination protein NusB
MLSRRSLRIKVMQQLYAFEQNPEPDIKFFIKPLYDSIQQAYSCLFYNLYAFANSCEYVQTDVQIKASKHLPKSKDKQISTRLLFNPIVQTIINDEFLNHELKNLKILSRLDEDIYRLLFSKLSEADEYKTYITLPEDSPIIDDAKILSFYYKKIILHNDLFLAQTEDLFPNWWSDRDIIEYNVLNFIKIVSEKATFKLKKLTGAIEEENEFALKLFEFTISNRKQLDEEIKPLLTNWDPERLAFTDSIIMRMALAEFLYFHEVPVKVTINEYLEIAKTYSTPRSSEFINGVLDKLLQLLRESDRLLKTGKGVIE